MDRSENKITLISHQVWQALRSWWPSAPTLGPIYPHLGSESHQDQPPQHHLLDSWYACFVLSALMLVLEQI